MGILKDFDCSTIQKDQAVDGVHKYNIIEPGLSYCGCCRNKSCEAFRKLVVCNRGAGTHVVNDDLVSGIVKCPLCQSAVEMDYVALYRCSATVTVLSQNEETMVLRARGSEIVKLGKRVGGPVFESALLTVDAKVDRECAAS